MDNYIIRIYRQEKNNPEKLVGVLEKVGEEIKKSSLRMAARKQAFTNIDELWEILNATGQLPRRKKKNGGIGEEERQRSGERATVRRRDA